VPSKHRPADELHERLASAKSRLADAEGRLQKLLGEITVMPRASKTTISGAVEAALEVLRGARVDLDDIEDSVTSIKISPKNSPKK
jgi:type VI protein secretion system component VasK